MDSHDSQTSHTPITMAFADRQMIDVIILRVRTAASFIIQENGESPNASSMGKKFRRFESALNDAYPLTQNLGRPYTGRFTDGQLVAVYLKMECKDTKQWFRAQIRNSFETTKGFQYDVYLLDYGTSAMVTNMKMRPLLSHLDDTFMPFQAVIFEIKDIKPIVLQQSSKGPDIRIKMSNSGEWNHAAVAMVEDCIKKFNYKAITIVERCENTVIYGNLLFDDGSNLRDTLINLNYAVENRRMLKEKMKNKKKSDETIEIITLDDDNDRAVNRESSNHRELNSHVLNDDFTDLCATNGIDAELKESRDHLPKSKIKGLSEAIELMNESKKKLFPNYKEFTSIKSKNPKHPNDIDWPIQPSTIPLPNCCPAGVSIRYDPKKHDKTPPKETLSMLEYDGYIKVNEMSRLTLNDDYKCHNNPRDSRSNYDDLSANLRNDSNDLIKSNNNTVNATDAISLEQTDDFNHVHDLDNVNQIHSPELNESVDMNIPDDKSDANSNISESDNRFFNSPGGAEDRTERYGNHEKRYTTYIDKLIHKPLLDYNEYSRVFNTETLESYIIKDDDDDDELLKISDDDDEDDAFAEREHKVMFEPENPEDDDIDLPLDFQKLKDPESVRNDACLRFAPNNSIKIPEPFTFTSLSRAPCFDRKLLSHLNTKFKYEPCRVQSHSWPCIMRLESVTCISGPLSGKTMTHLIAIFNQCYAREETEECKDPGVFAIIVCSGSKKVIRVANLIKKLKFDKNIDPRVITLYSFNESRQHTPLLNACDILITTPAPLLRYIKNATINVADTQILVFDDADVTVSQDPVAVRNIFIAFAQKKKDTKKSAEESLMFQTMVFAEQWTKGVQWIHNDLQFLPILIFSCFYEATIAYRNITCDIVYTETELNRESTLKSLIDKLLAENHQKRIDRKPLERIAIVCSSVHDCEFIRNKLQLQLDTYIIVHEKTEHWLLGSALNKWSSGKYVLLITDILLSYEKFDDATCLIHYKLPDQFKRKFGDRFRLMRSYLSRQKPISGHTNHESHINQVNRVEESRTLKTFVIVSNADKCYANQLCSFIQRLGQSIPEALLKLKEESHVTLCPRFASFGHCPFKTECLYRHSFDSNDIPDNKLPHNGQIKITVCYVLSANLFYVRINSYRNENHRDGKWQKLDFTIEDLQPQLDQFKGHSFDTVKNVMMNQIYGIEIRTVVQRCRVIEMSQIDKQWYEEYNPNDTNMKIRIFCIDYGHELSTESRKLFDLPEDLCKIPPLAYKAYMYGEIPSDNAYEWDYRATQKFYDIVDNSRVSDITAWIMRQSNGVFWLNDINVVKSLIVVGTKLNVRPSLELLNDPNKLAVKNLRDLPGKNTNRNLLCNHWINYRLSQMVSYSFLDDPKDNPITLVVVSHYVSLNEIYLQREYNLNYLWRLENQWNDNSKLKSLNDFVNDQLCLYKNLDENRINRAQITKINDSTVNLFFVDHGDTANDVPKSQCHQITEDHVKVLPFQAIRAKVNGVEPIKDVTCDLICDLTRNDEEQSILIIAELISKDNGLNTVRLFIAQDHYETEFLSLSKILVDNGYCVYMNDEENAQQTYDLQRNDDADYDIHQIVDMEEVEDELIMNFHKTITEQFNNEMDSLCSELPESVENKKKTYQLIREKRENSNVIVTPEDMNDNASKENAIASASVDYIPGDFDYGYNVNTEDYLPYDPDEDEECLSEADDDLLDANNEYFEMS